MSTWKFHRSVPMRAAAFTLLYLFGGLLLGFAIAFAFNGLPMHMPESTRTGISFGILLVFILSTGAVWGRKIAQLVRADQPRRMTWAGALSFGPAVVLAALVLGKLEVALIENSQGPDLPVYVIFTVLFVPAVFFVCGIGGLALGLAMKNGRTSLQSGLGSGLGGAAAFLLANLVMHQLGWHVGAPGAAERATMLTVLAAGALAASLGGGAALGYILSKQSIIVEL